MKKGFFLVFLANLLNLALSVLRNLILPKYLSIDTFAEIKMYQLYISYIGFAALGYTDGINLAYGGASLQTIDRSEFQKNIATFRWLEIIVSIIVVIVGILVCDRILVFTGLTIFAYCLNNYYRSFFQATGEFKEYTFVTNSLSLLIFIANIFLLFVLEKYESTYYICGYIIVYYLIWLVIEFKFTKRTSIKPRVFYFSRILVSRFISSGFYLMFALWLSHFMTSISSWCVRFLMTKYDFALYAFVTSIEGFLNYAIVPLSVTLYNFFCKHTDVEEQKRIKNCINVFLALMISGAFVVKFIMETYLQKYQPAQIVLFVLFASQFIYGVIKCFYLNIFKSKKRQKELFHLTVIIIVLGLILNIAFYMIFGNIEAFSFATLFSAIIWYLICERLYPEYKDNANETFYSLIIVVTYILCGLLFKSYIGFFLYLTICILTSFTLQNNATVKLFCVGKDLLLRRFNK